MAKHKKKVLALVCAVVLVVGLGVLNVVEAADVSVYVDPSETVKGVGESFVVSVKVDPAGQEICEVGGKLDLSQLICRRIKTGDGTSPQLFPSCNDISFMSGIQGCTTEKKTLLSVTVEAGSIGTGTASLTGVNVVGENSVPVPFAASSGFYEITEESSPEPPIAPQFTETPAEPAASACECADWGQWEWQNSTCGGSICSSSQKLQSQMRTCAPLGCDISINTRCIDDSSCVVDGIKDAAEVKSAIEVGGTDIGASLDLFDEEEAEDVLLDDESDSVSGSTLKTIIILLALVVIVETIVIISMASKKKKKDTVVQTGYSHTQMEHPHQ